MMEQVTFLNQMSFWAFAVMMVAGALGVVFHRSIVYSALFLLVTFLSIAGIFVLVNAPFLAAAQVLVYGVGLTIVLIFGIMLTGDQPFADPVGHERPKRFWLLPVVAAGIIGKLMAWSIFYPNFQLTTIHGLFSALDKASPEAVRATLVAIAKDGGVTDIAGLLFQKYVVPFELASILLLLAMMGAIILSKRELPEEEGETADLSDTGACSSEALQAKASDEGSSQAEKEAVGVS